MAVVPDDNEGGLKSAGNRDMGVLTADRTDDKMYRILGNITAVTTTIPNNTTTTVALTTAMASRASLPPPYLI